MPDNFEIANFWVIWLLPLPLIIYWVFPPLRIKSSSLLVPNFTKVISLTGKKSRKAAMVRRRNIFTWFFLMVIWLLLLASLASPQLVGKPVLKVKTSRNFLIVADISFSMARKDWQVNNERVSRWQAVKQVMHEFIAKRQGDRMGLIFFGSSAYIQAPFTPDLVTVEQLLEEADVGMAGQMTNIGKAIVKGIEMFDRDSIDTKIMLVLTDGVDSGTEILPLDAADLARNDSIKVYTIGIGDTQDSGSDLDEKTLQEIAQLTGAKYFQAQSTDVLAKVYEELDKLEPIEYEEETYKPRSYLYYYPLTAAIVLALVLTLIISGYSTIKLFTLKPDANDK